MPVECQNLLLKGLAVWLYPIMHIFCSVTFINSGICNRKDIWIFHPPKKPYLSNLDLHPAKRFKILTDDTWARSTWAADAVGPVLGWGGLGSLSVGRPGRPWFSWSGPRWHDLTRAAGGWGRSTHGNTRREPALVLGPTWPYRCSTLW